MAVTVGVTVVVAVIELNDCVLVSCFFIKV